jgi:uncharacterized protein (UPF0276 family)
MQAALHSAPTAGLSLKPAHYDDALNCAAPRVWFEVHPENYMVDGGPRLQWLQAIRTQHPLSLHGVGLSLAGDAAPDPAHLAQLRRLVQRFEPFIVSEHLAWSTWGDVYHPDLLPVPRTAEALQRLAENIDATQTYLARRILIENPSHYLHIAAHDYDEIDFLTQLCRRTGCGVLLDVNNVYVSANNLGFDAAGYIDAFPGEHVGEIHLAGHTSDPNLGHALLIDSHDSPICDAVWQLYCRLLRRIGARPTLIERDDQLPDFAELLCERERAQCELNRAS